MGFFAALTIEADNVWIDLNGFEITMGDEFYALQRFYNHIQFGDRLFVLHEGKRMFVFDL